VEGYNDTIKKQKKITFTIVSDMHNKIAERLGIKFTLPEELQKIYADFKINLPKYNGDDSWTLPMPTRLISLHSNRPRLYCPPGTIAYFRGFKKYREDS
jgi:hypothetical protein